MRKLILIWTMAFAMSTVNAQSPQYVWNEQAQKIYESITSLKIPEGRKLLTLEKKAAPNNLILTLLESYADFYELFLNEDPAIFKKLHPQFEIRIKQLEAGPKNSPYYLYSLGVVQLHKSLSAIRFDKNLEGAMDFRKSYQYFKENRKAYPNFSPNDFYFGVMTTVVGTIPKGYQWIANILGLNGRISDGNALVLKYLNSKDENNKRCRNEALLVYPYLIMNFEGNQRKTFNYIESIPYDFKRNQAHAYMATNLYLNHQQSKKALNIIQQMDKSDAYLALPFWNLETGYAYINELKLDAAKKALINFVNSFRGKFYIKDAYEKLSWIAYLQGDSKQAEAYRKLVLTAGNQVTDADKQAFQNAKKGIWPNALLLKSRLLSDGGYQTEAFNLLAGKTSNDFTIEADKTEFSYRLARICDLNGQDDLALKYYKSTMDRGANQPEYFAARAALQSGLIYESKGQFGKALVFYQLCIDMKDHAFKNSLDQKAKSGIQRCRKQ